MLKRKKLPFVRRRRHCIHVDVDEKLKSEEETKKKERRRIDWKSDFSGQNRRLKNRRGLQIYLVHLVRIRLEVSSFFLSSLLPPKCHSSY
jgi:hypothetical protein